MKGYTLPTPRIVVLAAGFSTRLGSPKALARVRGRSLLQRTIEVLTPLATANIVVVIPPRPGAGRRTAGRLTFVVNRARAQGLASSVRRGITNTRHSCAVLLLPVDLVELNRRDIARLISRWRGARRRITARNASGQAATPLILPRSHYHRALKVSGDLGLRDLVRTMPRARVSLVEMPSAQADVDTVGDLQRARRRARRLT